MCSGFRDAAKKCSCFFVLFFVFVDKCVVCGRGGSGGVDGRGSLFLEIVLVTAYVRPFTFRFVLVGQVILFFDICVVVFVPGFVLCVEPAGVEVLKRFVICMFFILFFVGVVVKVGPRCGDGNRVAVPCLFC